MVAKVFGVCEPVMQLKFVPVEEFFFALTLCVKPLEELEGEALVQATQQALAQRFGQASTIAAARQNTFNYVFEVSGVDNSPASQLVASISDWQGKLRLSSDYGWMLDGDRKPTRTAKHADRAEFTQQLKGAVSELLEVTL